MSDEPRIPPLPPEEWGGDPDLKRILEAGPGRSLRSRLGDNNIFPTFARTPISSGPGCRSAASC